MARGRRRRSRGSDLGGLIVLLLLAMIFLVHHVVVLVIVLLLAASGVTGWIYLLLRAREKLARSGIHTIDQMNGEEFERYLAALLMKLGFSKVRATRYVGDFGADVVMEKDGVRHVVQAKRYTSNVGVKAVQEIVAAKAHYGAEQAWVITNAGFTPAAVSLARSNDVRLIDRDELVKLILSVQAQQKSSATGDTANSSSS